MIRHNSFVERSQTSPVASKAILPTAPPEQSMPQKSMPERKMADAPVLGGHAAALLGISRVSPQTGERDTESAGRARHLRRDADRRRKVAVLPTAGGDFREDGGGRFSADRAHAGPGGTTRADGHSGSGAEQLSKSGGAPGGNAEEPCARGISAALSFAGATVCGELF
jgi:hypothetical protein